MQGHAARRVGSTSKIGKNIRERHRAAKPSPVLRGPLSTPRPPTKPEDQRDQAGASCCPFGKDREEEIQDSLCFHVTPFQVPSSQRTEGHSQTRRTKLQGRPPAGIAYPKTVLRSCSTGLRLTTSNNFSASKNATRLGDMNP